CKGCATFPHGCGNDEPCKPAAQPERPQWSRFNIFSFLQINLAPVAVERPVFAYTNKTCTTTTQTNRMKQILRAAKGSALGFFILLGVLVVSVSTNAQTNTWTAGSGTTNWST